MHNNNDATTNDSDPTLCIPARVLTDVAYFQAIETGKLAFEIEAPNDHWLTETFWEQTSADRFRDGVKSGEWVGDHAEIKGTFHFDDAPVCVSYKIDWYPADGGEAYVFIQFAWVK